MSVDADLFLAMDLASLRQQWRERLKSTPPAFRSRDLLARALLYRLEADRSGDLSGQTRKRITDLAKRFAADPDFDPTARVAPSVGAALVREWNGVRHVVLVTVEGFQYCETTYRSLSEVARVISGARWSGPRFFGLVGDKIEREAPVT